MVHTKKPRLSPKHFSLLLTNAIIYFDSVLYCYLVPILAPLFFPNQTGMLQMICGYSVLATSCLAKPLGVLFFSHMAQHKKEGLTLRMTLLGVSIGLLAISCLPTGQTGWKYGALGLLVARMIMDASAAGEHAIAKLYLIENASTRWAKKLSTWYEMSSMVGIILAGAVGSLFASANHWRPYWRLPFILAGILTLLLIFLRMGNCCTTPDTPTKVLFSTREIMLHLWKERRAIIRIAIVTGFSYVTYSIPFVFMNSFVPLVTNLSYASMMQQNTPLMIMDLCLLSVLGKVLPKYNHNNIMALASGLIVVSIIPLFIGLQGASMVYITLLRCWLFVLGVIFCSSLTVWCKEQVAPHNSYLTIGLATVLGGSLLGKSAPAICLALFYGSNDLLFPALYIAVLAFMATLVMANSTSE
ncbi:MAG: MFS transporter [Amoebophilaceae bacterium]|nr:MFS transporter [Amoebophilaceae bacterium]